MELPTISTEEALAILETKTAPRVTEELIKSKIDVVRYVVDDVTTLCIIRMKNGFRFIGKSAPVSADNFDPAVGRRYAYDDAFRQIWAFEGYLLREQLAAEAK